jgi:hypothetical protein
MDEMMLRRKVGYGMLAALILAFAILAAWVEPKPVLAFEAALVYISIAAYLIVSGESKS